MNELAAERTWDDNKVAINQLWPVATYTDEEARLWREDLSGLDQALLYDAIRNVKRRHDSVYPQLKWVLDGYRELAALRRAALKSTASSKEPKVSYSWDDAEDKRMARAYVDWIDQASPSDYRQIHDDIFEMENFRKMKSPTVTGLICYAKERLLGITTIMGKVVDGGANIKPLYSSASIPSAKQEVSL
jgi:hypothetical protein